MVLLWPTYDVIFADQVSAVIPVLKLKRSSKVRQQIGIDMDFYWANFAVSPQEFPVLLVMVLLTKSLWSLKHSRENHHVRLLSHMIMAGNEVWSAYGLYRSKCTSWCNFAVTVTSSHSVPACSRSLKLVVCIYSYADSVLLPLSRHVACPTYHSSKEALPGTSQLDRRIHHRYPDWLRRKIAVLFVRITSTTVQEVGSSTFMSTFTAWNIMLDF